jgi:CRISPR-associated protein Cmr4
MPSTLFSLCAKTHLHAGSGSTNYGVIDNLVQRDPVDELPCIFASSLKGALREFFEEVVEATAPPKQKPRSNKIFGPVAGDKPGKGTHIFHEALLLSLPVRSNLRPFFNATAPFVLLRLLEGLDMFNISGRDGLKKELQLLAGLQPVNNKPIVFSASQTALVVEEFDDFTFKQDIKISDQLAGLLGADIVLMSDADFKYQCSDYCLPIIARNNLENGTSKNLWYEQIVPRESRFYFYTTTAAANDDFGTGVHEQYVQVGANASIGYGKCFITLQNQSA